jgi:ribose-phosphate pyrophosphokinase
MSKRSGPRRRFRTQITRTGFSADKGDAHEGVRLDPRTPFAPLQAYRARSDKAPSALRRSSVDATPKLRRISSAIRIEVLLPARDSSCLISVYARLVEPDLLLFAGSASRKLGGAISDYLSLPLGSSETLTFSDGNLFVRVRENVRGRDVFVVQGTAFPANDNFMELLFWIDALKRASAASVTAVIPYFTYAKGDKKDEPRVSIRARVCADAIEAAGADRVVTMDLHAPQVQGFFKIPVDDLNARPVLCEMVSAKVPSPLVVVAPDAGFAKGARRWADRLGSPLAIAEKRRVDHSESPEVTELIGPVEGRTALIVDDFTISAGTLVEAARVLKERGATSVYAAVTHGLITAHAVERLATSEIERLFITDTVETQPVPLPEMIEVVSVAGLFGEAIRRIANRESVSDLFE